MGSADHTVTKRQQSGDIFLRIPPEIRDEIFFHLPSASNFRSLTRASPAMLQRSLANPNARDFWMLQHTWGSIGLLEAFTAHIVTFLRKTKGLWFGMHIKGFLEFDVRGFMADHRTQNPITDQISAKIGWVYGSCTKADFDEMVNFHRSVVRPIQRWETQQWVTQLRERQQWEMQRWGTQMQGPRRDDRIPRSAFYNFEIWCNWYGNGKHALGKPLRATTHHLHEFLRIRRSEEIDPRDLYESLLRVVRLAQDVYDTLLSEFIDAHGESMRENGGPETAPERREWYNYLKINFRYDRQKVFFFTYIRDAMVSRGLGLLHRVVSGFPDSQARDETVKQEVAIALRAVGNTKDCFSSPESIQRTMELLKKRGVNRFPECQECRRGGRSTKWHAGP
ncbi:hypothetical protein CPLU01_14919 [Colletotrichum plurivorum]|uniref:Uncharacterized protein n=1 Tax=Colletotrichum plurivorum TaxID=2175906 RepID=A0A8H6JFT9_9PEZI|nr:hypothetical protein CPLU01_14919 [Colletotrichum plurivorum]